MGYETTVIEADKDEPPRLLLTVAHVIALDDAGAFADGKHVELLEGALYDVSPVHLPHARAAFLLSAALDAAVAPFANELIAFGEGSVELDQHNLPRPDLFVSAPPSAGQRFGTPDLLRLIMEVSSSSVRYDLTYKARLYAAAGIPEYWVADIEARRMVVMWAPADDGYTRRVEHPFGGPVASATTPGLIVDTARLA